MFSEYALIDIGDICHQKSISVLNKLPDVNGPQLVTSLIKPLVNNLINNKSNNKQNENFLNCFQDDKDVHWIMEVICYGLSLPLADNEQYEAVRDCVNIYCEWLHSLSPSLSQDKFIPYPIRNDPNIYCQKIFGHLYNTFLPRTWNQQTINIEQINDLISKQALICHRILRLLITIANKSDNVINAKTWEQLLIFLLGINEKLLKSPTDKTDIGTQIADRVISTLFQGWLISCVYFFPSPSFWRTFQQVCMNSRHCPALIAQWNRVNICLTKRLVSVLYNHESTVPVDNNFNFNFSQYNSIVLLLSENVLEQCWYRFLHIIGNPIDLCFPKIISKMDPEWNISLISILPFIFHKAIKGLCTLVDIFLGNPNINLSDIEYELPKSSTYSSSSSHTPPEKRKTNSSISKNEKHSNNRQNQSNNQHHIQSKNNTIDQYVLPTIVLPSLLPGNFHQNHIKLSSILDIFGKWLFPAAFIGLPNISNDLLEKSISNNSDTSSSLQGPIKFDRMSIPNTDNDIEFSMDLFEAGQAEALGALCRLFCLKKDDEDISLILSKQNHPDFSKLKNYLTSFYLALKFNLQNINQNEQTKIQISSNILVNSIYLFDVDLPGSKILIPHFFRCMESFLTRKDKNDSDIIIRRACIKILISLLSYPIHYKNLPIKDDLSEITCNTFISFFPRLILLFINALYNETDQINVQMILNSFLFIIEDCFNYRQDLNGQTMIGIQNEINIDTNDSLVVNLMEFFNKTNCFYLQNNMQAQKLSINLFLLITSFISDILCKSSLKNSNYNISLTAIEILLAMGRIRSKPNSQQQHKHKSKLLCNNKCSLCIQQICCFIENQCYKKAMFHSKDMHTTIVAAYQCLSIWINEHYHLVNDKDCIELLFKLIELGISGSKSSKDDTKQFKCEKLIKPASLRVRDAAELFLATLMSQIKMDIEPNDNNIIPCDINEAKIAEHIFNIRSTDYSFNQFRYFIVENSLLISILDKQVGHGETVCIIRSAYGKYCFILKHQPISNRYLLNMGNEISIYRSLNKQEHLVKKNVHFNYFPDFYDKHINSQAKYDNMILNIGKYINEQEEIKTDYETMLNFLEKVEQNLNFEKAKLTINLMKKDMNEIPATKNFEAYRPILSQFENFNFDFKTTIATTTNGQQQQQQQIKSRSLLSLNNNSQSFIEQLMKLDMISNRINDMVMIFYVPKNFQNESDIFTANSQQYYSNEIFKYFLQSLGNEITCETLICSSIFYWNDALHELIFVTPTITTATTQSPHEYQKFSNNQKLSLNTFIMENNDTIRTLFLQRSQQQHSTNLNTNGYTETNRLQSQNERIKEFLFMNNGCDIKVFILWIEKMDDFDRLPFNKNVYEQHSNVSSDSSDKQNLIFIITIHPLKNGLFRVLNFMPNSNTNKFNNYPTIDRMLLSKTLLASYVKLITLNLFRRRRMNTESFQFPHVKRRLKIQEMANKFKISSTTNDQKLASEIFKSKFL
ncbi:ral GTPase-activating protein subunit beta [Dermatophagoides pteronyssinus]|uniref:ral GTPase-activating protein subunit beta n=1 Tax=Dermatophagoides pteronyssinus TaxID=6956 RepID=UPI003F663045